MQRTRHEAAKKEGKNGSGGVRQACKPPLMPTVCKEAGARGAEKQ